MDPHPASSTPASDPFWMYSMPRSLQAGDISHIRTFTDHLRDRLAYGEPPRTTTMADVDLGDLTDDADRHSHQSASEHASASPPTPRTRRSPNDSLSSTPSKDRLVHVQDWPLTEKYYAVSTEQALDASCPRPIVWKTIWWPTVVIMLPMSCLVAGLLALILGYRVQSEDSLFPEVSNVEALRDRSVVLVNYSATRIVFVASWASTLAPLLAGFVMALSRFPSAVDLYRGSRDSHQSHLPTPYQHSLLIGLGLASIGRLRRYMSYAGQDDIVIPPALRRAARTLTAALLLASVVFAADTALHYTTSTINLDQMARSATMQTYGRGLSQECLAMNRADNFGLPCSRNAAAAASNYTAYVADQNEIFFLQHGTSKEAQVILVAGPSSSDPEAGGTDDPGVQVALLTPPASSLSPFRDFQARSAAVVTTCEPISAECRWKSWGPDQLYSQFNCSDGFWGVLGKSTNVSDASLGIDDPDVPPLGFKPGPALQYGYFQDQNLDVPYDSTGTLGPLMTDAQLINPVYLAFAARFVDWSQRAGVNMSTDPGVYQGPTSYIDFVLRCQYTTYEAEYSWVNATARVLQLTQSPNGTLAEIYHGYNVAASMSAFDNPLQDMVLQAALASDAHALAAQFAASYSTRIMSVIGPFLSPRTNVLEQTRTPLLVAKVSKVPLALLCICCLGYVAFGCYAAVGACRALREIDVRDLAFRLSLPALALYAFRDPRTDRAAVEEEAGAACRVFDETRIRRERIRVAVEGSPRAGFELRSLL